MQTTTPYIVDLDRFPVVHYLTAEPPPETISKKLDRLAFNRDGILSLESQREALVSSALDQIRTVLNSIDAAISELRSTAAEIESDIKESVLTNCASVKGTALQAVFIRGRITYDSKGLDALAVVVPEVLNFRKEGEPTVSIREVKH